MACRCLALLLHQKFQDTHICCLRNRRHPRKYENVILQSLLFGLYDDSKHGKQEIHSAVFHFCLWLFAVLDSGCHFWSPVNRALAGLRRKKSLQSFYSLSDRLSELFMNIVSESNHVTAPAPAVVSAEHYMRITFGYGGPARGQARELWRIT